MAFTLSYATGTVSVANGATAVTGSGVTWTTIREGDTLLDPATGARALIASIEDTSGALTLLDPWPGTSLTDDAYRIVYDSPARRSGVVVSAAVEELVANQTALLARRADYLAQDVLLNTPPGSPTVGDLYVVGTSPTGAWAGKGGYLATWTAAAAWAFTAPEAGMRVVDIGDDPPGFYFRGASAWGAEGVPESGVSADTYGSATEIPVITVGADGRVTAVETAPAAGVRSYPVLAHQIDSSLATAAAGTLSGGGITNPARCLDFDASSYEYARVFLPMPKAWDLGPVDVRIGWAPADANAGNVVWAARASVINADDATSNFALDFGGVASATSAAPGAMTELQVAILTDCTPSGTPAAGSLLSILIARSATSGSDTYAADARLVFVEVLFGVTSNSDE